MCLCDKPWISEAVDIIKLIPDERLQLAAAAYDLACKRCGS